MLSLCGLSYIHSSFFVLYEPHVSVSSAAAYIASGKTFLSDLEIFGEIWSDF